MLRHDRASQPPNVQLLFTDGKNVLYVCTRLAESKIQELVVSFKRSVRLLIMDR